MVGSIAAGLMLLGIVAISVQTGAPEERVPLLECGAEGRGSTGMLSGTISDASGGAISGASIVVSCGSFRQTFSTDPTGAYCVQLPPGRYALRVTAENFSSAEAQMRVSAAGSAVELNFTLSVEPLHVNVQVAARERYPVGTATSGSKAETSLGDVPQSITVVDRALLTDQNAHRLDDALKNVAGVMPGGFYEPWDGYRIRGFDASFTTYLD